MQKDEAAEMASGEAGKAQLVGSLNKFHMIRGGFGANLNAVGGSYGRFSFLLHIFLLSPK